VCCKIDGKNDCFSPTGAGPMRVDQSRCTAQFTIEALGYVVDYTGAVTNTTVVFSGDLVPDIRGVSCRNNELVSRGTIGRNRIDFTFSGGADCTAGASRVTCTVSGKDTWTR
jgi:hypothetical protein